MDWTEGSPFWATGNPTLEGEGQNLVFADLRTGGVGTDEALRPWGGLKTGASCPTTAGVPSGWGEGELPAWGFGKGVGEVCRAANMGKRTARA